MTDHESEATIRPATPETGIAWVEAQILDKLTRSGPWTFQALAEAIPVRRRNLGFALSRLKATGAVIVAMDAAKDGAKVIPAYTLAAAADRLNQGAEVRTAPVASKCPAKT